ncbi:MAG: hypothetical protein KDA42_17195 [Planctomycetales bacterium]|nr:hypothetical protein [Planctomycetales bacterium]
MLDDGVIEYRRLRAPREDGATLIDPPWKAIGRLLADNLRLQSECDRVVGGRSLRDLQSDTRSELIDAARQYTTTYANVSVPPTTGESPIVCTGHQPELFHPGVWLKDFAADRLAREHRALSLNLVIDSDMVGKMSVRVPTGAVADPVLESVPFDLNTGNAPFELTRIADHDCFESFGERAAETLAPLVADPLVRSFWPLAIERSRAGARLGEAIAQARHRQEIDWGATNLELPQSRACQSRGYRWLISHILADLARFRESHNCALREYRRVHRIRNAAQPVPELHGDEDWLESPFWVYRNDMPVRRALWARRSGKTLMLADRAGWQYECAVGGDGDRDSMVEQLGELTRQGVHIRTRALTTTMFARLLLSDLFIHGIGGAKYDQLTDAIILDYFGMRPPAFLTVTGTLKLPIPRSVPRQGREREIAGVLRNMRFHPERVLLNGHAALPQAQAWLVRKDAWIQSVQSAPAGHVSAAQHEEISQINQRLSAMLDDERERLLVEQQELSRQMRSEAVLGSREYAFCLHPEAKLRSLMLALPAKKA